MAYYILSPRTAPMLASSGPPPSMPPTPRLRPIPLPDVDNKTSNRPPRLYMSLNSMPTPPPSPPPRSQHPTQSAPVLRGDPRTRMPSAPLAPPPPDARHYASRSVLTPSAPPSPPVAGYYTSSSRNAPRTPRAGASKTGE
ncbi:hypothetical protein BU17DRAFT_67871 [Hysterangium stoloniferum]|nr:hypothetical protein BU17DRAFT_67871 [Hysterangium stoloniferum]